MAPFAVTLRCLVLLGTCCAAVPAAAQSRTESVPAPAASARLENPFGGTRSLHDFQGKVVLLTVAGKGPAEEAGRLSAHIGVEVAARTDFVRVCVIDLNGMWGILRAAARSTARNTIQDGNRRIEALFQRKGVKYESRHMAVYLLDWESAVARPLGIAKKVGETFQVFVLDREGRITFRSAQQPAGTLETSCEPAVLDAVRGALNRATKEAAGQKPSAKDRGRK